MGKFITKIIVVLLLIVGVTANADINEGATPIEPDIYVQFEVDNPDVTISAFLPGEGGDNSTDAHAEFTLNGTGSAFGTFEAHSNPKETGWANVIGGYYAGGGDITSTFTAECVRTNTNGIEGLTSTFTTNQSLEVTGIEPLVLTDTDQFVSGLSVSGEAWAAFVPDTWVLGTGQVFDGSAESITLTFENNFEQCYADGSPLGTPITGTLSFTTAGCDSFSGVVETGSYDAATLGLPHQPGFGFAMSSMTLDVQKDSMTSLSSDVNILTDQIVGETTTWYMHPGYPGAP